MFKSNEEFSYEKDPNFDFVIDEKANKFMALRKIKWSSSNEFKLDLRNYVATDEGERMLKGCTFISEEGGHELARVLVQEGYGHTDDLVDAIFERRELLGAIAHRINDSDPTEIEHAMEEYNNRGESLLDLDEVI